MNDILRSVCSGKEGRDPICCIRYGIVDKDICLCLLKSLFSSVLTHSFLYTRFVRFWETFIPSAVLAMYVSVYNLI